MPGRNEPVTAVSDVPPRGTFRLLVADEWRAGPAAEGRRVPAHPGYELLDSGEGRKLERFGNHVFDRPDTQAIWPVAAPGLWQPEAIFDSGAANPDGEAGEWRFKAGHAPDPWLVHYRNLILRARCTAFRHLGLFPEHSVHWSFAEAAVRAAKRPTKVLNLFGYSGVMSLCCAAAGAQVTHVDASPKAIGYGRENQALSRLEDRPIRWICDDAVRFLEREIRRESFYDGVVLDPPKHGRGPKGEIWKLEEGLPYLLDLCRRVLTPEPLFLIATVYAVRMSFLSLGQALAASLEAHPSIRSSGELEWGEMALREQSGGRLLPTAIYARWHAGG